jgi:hypothetical protein
MKHGVDNHCGDEPGDGLVDEMSGAGGFSDPANPNNFCWTSQSGATLYQVVRSDQASFPAWCAVVTTFATCMVHPGVPPSGASFYYLARPLQPNPGSWGADAAGNERIGSVVCEEKRRRRGSGGAGRLPQTTPTFTQ